MQPSERIAYSAIPDRPKLSLPDGARLAVWVIINVEEWNPREPLPRTVLGPPAGGSPIPDIPNWAWHEYGNRVGFWRMLEVLDHFQIRAVLAINGSAIHTYEPIARAAHERGWEFIGHGFGQKNQQAVPDERANIVKTSAAIRDFTGRAPRGWLGPGAHWKPGKLRIFWPKKVTITCAIGFSTTNRCLCERAAGRSSASPTRRKTTMSP